MARVVTPLNDTRIRQAKPKKKEYNLSDGDGLHLRIKPTGSKLWLFNCVVPHTERRTNTSLGIYPDVTLAGARKLRAKYRSLLAENIDPKEHREREELTERKDRENTLSSVAERWIAWKRPTVSDKQQIPLGLG